MIFLGFTTAAIALASVLPSGLANGNPQTINVQVGPNNQQVFQPPSVNANNNDIINFIFNPKQHSVTQSSFNNPCQRVQNGFDSGIINVDQNQQRAVQFTVRDNQQLFFFSSADNDCRSGMVFTVNVNQQQTQQFQQNARQTNQNQQNQNQNQQNQNQNQQNQNQQNQNQQNQNQQNQNQQNQNQQNQNQQNQNQPNRNQNQQNQNQQNQNQPNRNQNQNQNQQNQNQQNQNQRQQQQQQEQQQQQQQEQQQQQQREQQQQQQKRNEQLGGKFEKREAVFQQRHNRRFFGHLMY